MDMSDLFFRYQTLVVKWSGFWEVSKFKNAYAVYRIIQVISETCFILPQILYLCMNFHDLSTVIDASFAFISIMATYVKLLLLLRKKESFLALVDMTKNESFYVETEEKKIICKGRIKDIVLKFIVLLGSVHLSVNMAGLTGISEGTLPFRGWFPFSIESSPNYEIMFLHQYISVYFIATLNISLDNLMMSLMSFGCAQMEMLNHKMRVEIAEEHIEDEQMEDNYKTINRWVYKHQCILDFIAETERTVNIMVFIQLTSCVCASCVTAIQLITITPGSTAFIYIVVYFFGISFQSMLLFRQGDELTTTSSSLHDAVYSCHWIRLDEKCRKAIFLIYERIRKPTTLRALNFFDVSNSTYLAIMKTSYSYFALLRSMRED